MNRLIAAFVFAAVLGSPARADNEPLLWPDGTITYRDWGLYRGGVPVLIERPYGYYGAGGGLITKSEGTPYYPGNVRDPYYYPTNHRDPNAYRMKPPIRPVPAEPYHRSWGVGSDPAPAPASDPVQQSVAPVEGPTVIYAPKEHERRRK